jgi:hypothetical protein
VKNFLEYIFCRNKNQEKNKSKSLKLRPHVSRPTKLLDEAYIPDVKYHLRET